MAPPVTNLMAKIAILIINPAIVLGFVVATIYLFYAIVQMILSSADESKLKEKRENVMYAVIGLFIMFSVYGILALVKATFHIP